jgi:hypothetical protein
MVIDIDESDDFRYIGFVGQFESGRFRDDWNIFVLVKGEFIGLFRSRPLLCKLYCFFFADLLKFLDLFRLFEFLEFFDTLWQARFLCFV